jgi:DNA-binding XRE family transcriptional regulator
MANSSASIGKASNDNEWEVSIYPDRTGKVDFDDIPSGIYTEMRFHGQQIYLTSKSNAHLFAGDDAYVDFNEVEFKEFDDYKSMPIPEYKSGNGKKKQYHNFQKNERVHPTQIKIRHFRNDLSVRDLEYMFQSWYAKKMYTEWLKDIRSMNGWENFRRRREPPAFSEPATYVGTNVGKTIDNRGRKLPPKPEGTETVSSNVLNTSAGKRSAIATSKERGVSADDDQYIPEMFTPSMGKQIMAARSQKLLTQRDLANKLNLNVSIIMNIEKGNYPFNKSDPVVRQLEKELNISIKLTN